MNNRNALAQKPIPIVDVGLLFIRCENLFCYIDNSLAFFSLFSMLVSITGTNEFCYSNCRGHEHTMQSVTDSIDKQ